MEYSRRGNGIPIMRKVQVDGDADIPVDGCAYVLPPCQALLCPPPHAPAALNLAVSRATPHLLRYKSPLNIFYHLALPV